MYIYAHIPFCQSKCIYCDFFVVLNKHAQSPQQGHHRYLQAVVHEFQQRLNSLPDGAKQPIQTLYLGGGTPGLVAASDYQPLFETLATTLGFDPKAEVTLEVNPTALASSAKDYKALGINRVSIGIQSLNDTELKKLSRAHNHQEAITCVQQFQEAGINNISIDLMYGIPTQTEASWQQTLEKGVALNVPHISMYGLKVEDTTPLASLLNHPVAKTSYSLPSDESTVAMYEQAVAYLSEHGYHLYEFSNLAKLGYESRHNLNYWNNQPFMGLGVSATGYLQTQDSPTLTRYETVRDLSAYLENPLSGEYTTVTEQEQLENALIFGLRKSEGVDLKALSEAFKLDVTQHYQEALERLISQNLLRLEGNQLSLTQEAIPVSNSVLAEFLHDV